MDVEVKSSPERPERKTRKSVAFTTEQIVVDADGSVTMVAAGDENQSTAQSHTPRTPPLSAALEAFNDPLAQAGAENGAAGGEGDLDLTLKKKKKKKVPKEDGEGGDEDGAEPAAAGDGGLDLTMKKKKKKKVPKDAETDEFAAKLKALDLDGKEGAAAGAEGEEGAEAAVPATKAAAEGDMDAGTGVWMHDDARGIPYSPLLQRFYRRLEEKNPDHALSGTKSYKIPPPQCMREGNKKTIFANIAEICKRMKRTDEHVTAYLFAELGTSGSTDGSRRLVIKGRFQQKQIENVLRKYIIEYVTCKTCRSPDTELSKGENRLYFITCNSCGSRRSVTAIKTGFSAQVGKRRKMQG